MTETPAYPKPQRLRTDGRKHWVRIAVFWGECYFARRGFWRTDLGSNLKGWNLRLGSKSLSGRKLTILLHWHPARHWDPEAKTWSAA